MAWLAAACLALVVVGGGAGVQYYQANAVASVISLDVNPSVELDVNRQEKVVSAVPLNADANEILDGMDLKGADLNVAVNAIMGSLLKHGYVAVSYTHLDVYKRQAQGRRSADFPHSPLCAPLHHGHP